MSMQYIVMRDSGGFGLFVDFEYLAFLELKLLPAFLPDRESVKLMLETHCVWLVVDGEVGYGVLCKQAHGGVKVLARSFM